MLNKIKYYIIGPRHNWEIGRSTFIVVGAFLSLFFLSLILIPIYQYFVHEFTSASLQKGYEIQKSTTQKLESNLDQLKQKIIALQLELEEKNSSLENLQTLQKSDNQAQQATQEKVFNYQLELNNLLTAIKNKDSQIENLKDQQKKYSQQIQSLSVNISKLEKQLKNLPSKKPDAISSLLTENSRKLLAIDQFQINKNKNKFSIRFNLRNLSDQPQSGFISIVPLHKEELNQTIVFNRQKALPFSTKIFYPITTEFEQRPERPFAGVRVIVWDKNEKDRLNQNFLIK
ncbi:MAG: hypothetical protein HQM13_14905 [SAR324 cluster bacterium]|nr:hypothetical protein [SAR324 cluster bacterium]